MAILQTAMDSRLLVADPPEQGLEQCGTCGHSQRNHEQAAFECARSLCGCSHFDLTA